MSALRRRADAGGYTTWSPADPELGVAFVGRGAARPRREVLAAVSGSDRPVGWLRQVHGCDRLEARAGCAGPADALLTTRRDLALAVSTADCVPLVLLAPGRAAAAHAGWRGVVAGVVATAVDAFAGAGDAPSAWIGPAIGPCCYEVGEDVASRVLDACGEPEVAQMAGTEARPHIDLQRAVEAQLRRAGVTSVETARCCTYCDPQLHSFRRDGAAAGRNLAFAWLPPS